ncbi:MAG: glycosyltransferase [bacterium]|nr:glycosyltransferase [bacterium]
MKDSILLVLTRPPYPAVDGTRERILNEIEDLSKDFEVSILIIGNENLSSAQESKLHSLGVKSVKNYRISKIFSYANAAISLFSKKPLQAAYFWNKHAYHQLKSQCNQFRSICFHTIRFGEYISLLKKTDCHSKILVFFNDAISLNYADASKKATGIWRYIYKIESSRVCKYETKILALVDKASIVSERDRAHILSKFEQTNTKDIKVIRHSMDERLLSYNYSPKTNNLAFIGNLLYPPNRQGLEIFCSKILPLITKAKPETKLIIIGRQSKELFSKYSSCIPMGFVDDPYTLLAEQAIFISPADFGAGVPTKSLLAMSIGLPVVSTANNAAGIEGVKENENIIFMDYAKPTQSASKILELLDDETRRIMIGSAGKKIVSKLYRRSLNYPLLKELL